MSATKGKRSRVTVRLPRVLHRRLAACAAAAGVDLNTWMNRCLEAEVMVMDKRAYDTTLDTLKKLAPGLSEPIRQGIARSIGMKLGAEPVTEQVERMRLRDNPSVCGPVVERSDYYITIENETTETVTRSPEAFEPAPPLLETPKMLVLSTSHITKVTDSNFGCHTDDVPGIYYSLPCGGPGGEIYGWLIPCGHHIEWSHMVTADLLAIRKLAEANGCTWIMLDRDGDTVDDLPVYVW